MPYTPDLDRLLTAGMRYADEVAQYVLESHQVGLVKLPTGQVVGCDPLTLGNVIEPFTVEVAPGEYPLHAWVAVMFRDGQESDRRTAALQLSIVDAPVTRWELALAMGQDLSELGETDFFGYGVDAGCGTLADMVALHALSEWEYERVDDVFIMAKWPYKPVPGVVAAVTDEATGANVVTVSSGFGDGVYPTFIGYTAAGQVACYVTDFLVVPAKGS